MTTFKIAGNSDLPLTKNDKNVMNYLKYRNQHFRILQIQYGLMIIFKATTALVLLLGGSYLVLEGQLSIGQFVGAELLMLNIMAAIEKLMLGMDNIYDVLTALEKLGSVTDIELEKHQGLDFKTVLDNKALGIEIENLNYQYPDDPKLTLNKVAFTINPSEKVCVAGFGGSGKSTLLRILNGSFANFKGSILYNGVPIQDIEYSSMQEKMGDISSQEDIFNGTLLENITVGRRDIELKMVVEMAREVGLLPFIQKLPDGFNTMLNAEGRMLPSSVKQKIIIARSLINQPAIIMMDAGLQEFDTQTAEHIADFLTHKNKTWTLITVSNEMLLAKRCDKIIVMREGQVIDIGTFQEIQAKDYFNDLFI
jgi:ABC-type bacteriocin/lantibiotic exporter with double-glycine peptidase domain